MGPWEAARSAAVAAGFMLSVSGGGRADIIGVAGGSGPPPASLGPYLMTLFSADATPMGVQVLSVPSPGGEDLKFSYALTHYRVSQGWPTSWGAWYLNGDVYEAHDGDLLTLHLPTNTRAFYLYVHHLLGGELGIQVAPSCGTPVSQTFAQTAGAHYYGFYQSDAQGPDLHHVSVSAGFQFAIGATGIAAGSPADFNGNGDVDQQDLGILLSCYGLCEGHPLFDSRADVDASGCVDQVDLGTLLADWTG
jgi:hypothetical protein